MTTVRLDHREALRTSGTHIGEGPDAIACFGFRWRALAMIGGTRAAQDALLVQLAPQHVVHPFDAPGEENATAVFGSAEDGVDPVGAILPRDRAPERLALVAEEPAKSAALSHHEARLAAIFDRLDPLMASLTSRSRLDIHSRPLLRAIGEAMAARNRITVLDRKRALVGEMVQALLALITFRRSAVLEIALATLIAIEVPTTLHEVLFR